MKFIYPNLEHDRSLDEKRVEKLLTAFDTEEEIAERAKEKAKQEEISKLAEQNKNSKETSEATQAPAKSSFSFGKLLPKITYSENTIYLLLVNGTKTNFPYEFFFDLHINRFERKS